MYKFNKDSYATYKEFFFYGIDRKGEKELGDALIFFPYMHEVKTRGNKSSQVTISGEEQLEATIKRAKELALQYYRFVTLNGQRDIPLNYDKSKKDQIEEKIKKRLELVVADKQREGSLQIKSDGIHFSRDWFRRYSHFPEYSIPEADGFIMRNWTEEMYDILTFLENTEKCDPKGYYDLWLRTRIKRIETDNENIKFQADRRDEMIQNEKQIRCLKAIAEKVRRARMKERKDSPERNQVIKGFYDYSK